MRLNTKLLEAVLIAALLPLPGGAASAHHSTSEFNYAETVIIKGLVKEVQWTNPHSYLQVIVDADGDASEQWSVEIGSPSLNVRNGWQKDSVQRGDMVVLDIAPARNGSNYGTLRVLTKADGRTLKGVAAIVKADKNGTPQLK